MDVHTSFSLFFTFLSFTAGRADRHRGLTCSRRGARDWGRSGRHCPCVPSPPAARVTGSTPVPCLRKSEGNEKRSEKQMLRLHPKASSKTGATNPQSCGAGGFAVLASSSHRGLPTRRIRRDHGTRELVTCFCCTSAPPMP
jgi:hypothetical protein